MENMRREGYEFEVGPPKVITKTCPDTGGRLEPMEEAVVEVPEEHVGQVVDLMGQRKAQMIDMSAGGRAGGWVGGCAGDRFGFGFGDSFFISRSSVSAAAEATAAAAAEREGILRGCGARDWARQRCTFAWNLTHVLVPALPWLCLPAGSEATTRLKYEIPTRALLGLRNAMLTATKGTAVLNTNLIG